MNRYKIIYADPGWTYKTWSGKGNGRSAGNHYLTMTIEEIHSLPVHKIACKDSVLLLWTTMPLLREGIETIECWGFTYKTCAFTWVKKNKNTDSWFLGLGYYTRSNAELCLLGTRGSPLKRRSKSVRSVIATHRGAHSKKPHIVRDKIVELFGDLPRMELFARERVPGWDSLGYEVDGLDLRQSLYMINISNLITLS